MVIFRRLCPEGWIQWTAADALWETRRAKALRGKLWGVALTGVSTAYAYWQDLSPFWKYTSLGTVVGLVLSSGGIAVSLVLDKTRADSRRRLAAEPRATPTIPLSEGWLERRLIDASFDEHEVLAHAAHCFRFLQRAGSATQADAQRFVDDGATRHEIQQMFRDGLRDP